MVPSSDLALLQDKAVKWCLVKGTTELVSKKKKKALVWEYFSSMEQCLAERTEGEVFTFFFSWTDITGKFIMLSFALRENQSNCADSLI